MKQFLLSFFLLVLAATGLQAQTRYVGYTHDDSITVSGGAFGQAGTYTIGAIATPQMLAPYEGCRVVGLRMASALELGRTRTFVYNIEGASLTPVVEQRQRLYEGWNQVLFNGDGYTINGTESLFFGFDYEETAEMVSADEGALCGVGDDVDGAFYAYGNFGSGLGLYSLTGIGRLCVQLIVDVSSLPQHDLDLVYFDAGFKYRQPGENIDALCSVLNSGLGQVDTYQLAWQLDDRQPVVQNFDEPLRASAEDSWQFTCPLPDDIETGMHRLAVYISQVQGEPLSSRSKNDTLTATFAIYRDAIDRTKAYFEIYSDQTSPYVPYLDEAVALLKQGRIGDNFTVVNVHRPGTPLALPEAAYLHQLYAYDWPTFTVNRAYFPGEAYVSYDMNDYLPVLPAEMNAGIIEDMLYQDLYTPAFASVDLKADYQPDSRALIIRADGRLLPEAEAIYGKVAITLMLVEDSVESQQAVYNTRTQRTTTDQHYLHHDVLRAFVTAPTGDGLTATDHKFAAAYEATLSPGWRADRMHIVALLTKAADTVTDDNVKDVDVINATTLYLDAIIPSGISTVTASGASGHDTFFSLDGKQVDPAAMRPGVYVRRSPDGTARKFSVR